MNKLREKGESAIPCNWTRIDSGRSVKGGEIDKSIIELVEKNRSDRCGGRRVLAFDWVRIWIRVGCYVQLVLDRCRCFGNISIAVEHSFVK